MSQRQLPYTSARMTEYEIYAARECIQKVRDQNKRFHRLKPFPDGGLNPTERREHVAREQERWHLLSGMATDAVYLAEYLTLALDALDKETLVSAAGGHAGAVGARTQPPPVGGEPRERLPDVDQALLESVPTNKEKESCIDG